MGPQFKVTFKRPPELIVKDLVKLNMDRKDSNGNETRVCETGQAVDRD